MATSAKTSLDQTFRDFSADQAAKYAALRGRYPAPLYDFIIDHHRSTGGGHGLVLDVGCGPGNATRDLAPHFDAAIGVDHGDGMIKAAIELGGVTAAGKPIEYRVCGAENFDKLDGVEAGSVDMVTACTAIHWFDMPKFWAAAANVLKPRGTVAIWTYTRMQCHPSTPNADKIDALFDDFSFNVLRPYQLPRNLLVRDGLKDLVMPWSPDCTPAVATAFDRASVLRKGWGMGVDGDERFMGNYEMPLAALQRFMVETSSPVVRWREANPELAGTDADCVNVLMGKMRELLGVPKGEEDTFKVRGGGSPLVLMVKRVAA